MFWVLSDFKEILNAQLDCDWTDAVTVTDDVAAAVEVFHFVASLDKVVGFNE